MGSKEAGGRTRLVLKSGYNIQVIGAEKYTGSKGIFYLSPSSVAHASPEIHRCYHTAAQHNQVPSRGQVKSTIHASPK